MPGDWIIADRDGVVVIPAGLLNELADRAEQLAIEERFCAELLRTGWPLRVAFPLQSALRPLLARYCADGTLPSDDEIRAVLP